MPNGRMQAASGGSIAARVGIMYTDLADHFLNVLE